MNHESPARKLYRCIVDQARTPCFYLDLGVPDTPDGRFDMIALHAFLILYRLRRQHELTADLAQEVFDTMFDDMDQNLREMGVGDLAVGKRVKGMARSFYGRISAYQQGLESSDNGRLIDALKRNVYRKTSPNQAHVASLAAYSREQVEILNGTPVEHFLEGRVKFRSPPRGVKEGPHEAGG